MKFSLLKNICWGNWLFFIIIAFLFVISLLSACGSKGNLYLPDKPSGKPSKTANIINIK
jgi:predicted small lipoprotein YifL